ncbi:MAG: sulfite exporter TauE/SafE family protein [Myxococcota bacterium]
MDLLTPTFLLGLLLAVGIGVSLGLLGGGGSILTVPILVYVLGLETHHAIAMSLLVVGTTSVTALIPHARGGRVRWKTGALFGLTSMVGAYSAGRVAHYIPPTALLVAFGVMMLVTSVAMMRKKASPPANDQVEGTLPQLPVGKIIAEGLAVGAVTGLVGAGGGFLVVPALVLLGRLPMGHAVGTSLLVIAMKSYAAFAGYLSKVEVDWTVALLVTVAAVAGSFVGGGLAGRIAQETLRKVFAWFIVVMSAFILVQEVPRALGMEFSMKTHWPWVLGAVAVPLVAAIISMARERPATLARGRA